MVVSSWVVTSLAYSACFSGTWRAISFGMSKSSGSCPEADTTMGRMSKRPLAPFQPSFWHTCGSGKIWRHPKRLKIWMENFIPLFGTSKKSKSHRNCATSHNHPKFMKKSSFYWEIYFITTEYFVSDFKCPLQIAWPSATSYSFRAYSLPGKDVKSRNISSGAS